MDLDAAVDAALEEMPDTFLILRFLLEHGEEVRTMFCIYLAVVEQGRLSSVRV